MIGRGGETIRLLQQESGLVAADVGTDVATECWCCYAPPIYVILCGRRTPGLAFGTGCVIQCDKEDKGLIRLEGGPQQIASARRLIEEKIGQVSSPQRYLPTDRSCFFYGLPPGFYRRVCRPHSTCVCG